MGHCSPDVQRYLQTAPGRFIFSLIEERNPQSVMALCQAALGTDRLTERETGLIALDSHNMIPAEPVDIPQCLHTLQDSSFILFLPIESQTLLDILRGRVEIVLARGKVA